jgi:ABC-2 type transport system ATP-binding protein
MPNNDAPLLEVRDLIKTYDKTQAVRGVSFELRQGICFGLLGPNGAGKTTTLEMIEGIIEPTSGEIRYRGETAQAQFREKIGIQFQATALPDFLTVREVLDLFRSFYKTPAQTDQLIEWCALKDFVDQDASELSGGQRQRLLLALGLINEPELIFLDEPTTGLDPQARRNFWELVREIKRRGKTVLLTTHYMEEAYVLCDEIAIMDHGKVIAHGAPDKLLKQHFQGLAIQLARADVKIPFADIPGKVFEKDDLIEIQTDQVDLTLKALVDRQVPLTSLRVRSRDLEDLFLALTGKAIRA